MRILVAVAALAAACASVGAGADGLRARVSPVPTALSTSVWTPTVTLTQAGRPASAPLVVTIRKGAERRSFAARAVRRGLYRVRIAFPSDGRWDWALASRGRTIARGAVTVSALVRFQLPYDLAVAPDGTIYFVDRGRVLRWEPRTRRVRVHAVTASDELVALARAADGTIYLADLPGNRILRVDAAARVTQVARLAAPGDIVLDPSGRTLWAGSLEDGVFRIDIAGGEVERIAEATSPHGIDRDAAGNLVVHDGTSVVRIDVRTRAKSTLARVDGIKLLVAPDGSVYSVVGRPSGGRVLRIAPDGRVTPVVGTGSLGPHADGRALDAQILPSAVQLAPDGALLVAQVQPLPAIRRVDLAAGTITTLVRGR